MLNFLGKRLQKAMAKMNAKTTLSESDILAVTREIKMALLEADVNLVVVKKFINAVKEKVVGSELIGQLNPGQQMIKIVKEELVKVLGSTTKEIKISKKPIVIMMVGLQGSGKTTTTAKVVNYFTRKKLVEKPLMVAADIYRPAAIEQLQTLGKEIGTEVYAAKANEKPQVIAKDALAMAKNNDYDMVIIDTAGRLSIDVELMNELSEIKDIVKPDEILFVADALSGQDIINVATTFNDRLKLTGSIITKLDSDARGGAALSLTKILGLPIKFTGTGEKISNLDLFHPDRMADRILGMGDVLSLIEKAEEVINEKKAKKITNRMFSGKFDLDDLLEQLKQMKKLGKLGKLIKMIPGANDISKDKIHSAEKKQKLYEILISSMTREERKNPRLLKNANRKNRIIKGSGRSNQEYNSLVSEFERMQKQMKLMAKSIKNGTFNPGSLGGMM